MDGNKGDAVIRQRVAELTGKPIMSTSQAVIAAMKRLGLKRVAMLTPYNEDLTKREIGWLASNEVEVIDFHYRDIEKNLDRGAQFPEKNFELARRLNWRDADGIFLSCGNVRYLEIIEPLERLTGKPVVTSSAATTWLALRMAGVTERIDGFGQLLKETTYEL
jgi:maleate isomerase